MTPHTGRRRHALLTWMVATGLLTMGLAGCDKAEDLYSDARAFLYFNNATHNDATLATAMTRYSGAFVTITARDRRFYFVSNKGLRSEVNMTAIDTQRPMVLGFNNGLIVGYGTSVDGEFYAYDRECPNCFSPNALPVRSYPVAVDDFGRGSCAHCGRGYDLNNGGFVSSGDAGRKLTRYRATTTGPMGSLTVQ